MSRRADRLLSVALRVLAWPALLIVVLIVAFVAWGARPALSEIGFARFFNDRSWHPAEGPENGRFNLLPMLLGTLLTSAGALLLAGVFGVAVAIFSCFFAPPALKGLFDRLLEVMAGIPSVVYGLWALLALVPLIRAVGPPGQSLLAGILVLAIMILPTIALLTKSALAAVPNVLLQGAAALGLSRWATIWSVILPAARGGIRGALLLAFGRALGETMALLMVTGNVVAMPTSLFQPIRTLSANIALELGYALEFHRSALFVGGLVLIVAVACLVLAAARERENAIL
jgi:phosphate transport system permease protein